MGKQQAKEMQLTQYDPEGEALKGRSRVVDCDYEIESKETGILYCSVPYSLQSAFMLSFYSSRSPRRYRHYQSCTDE